MARRKIRTIGEFIGLDISKDEIQLPLQYATVANNLMVVDGKLEPRLGRKELAKDFVNNEPVLGMYTYNPVGAGFKSMVIVRKDGIYQRQVL